MRGIGIAAAVVLSVPLAGCFNAMLPPKELPDWAMSQQVEATPSQRTRTARSTRVHRLPDKTAAGAYIAATNARSAEVLPFSPEWQAREAAFDIKLKRSMNICRGC
jgi:hypothetical protein